MRHTQSETDRLLRIIEILRTHCAWTRALSHESLRSYLVEESYEVIDAIGTGDKAALREELGDLLLQIVLHSQIARESGHFSFDEVARGLSEKMLRRNRHIFEADGRLREDITQDVAEIIGIWDAAKAEEKRGQRPRAGLPAGMPALSLSQKMLSRQRRAGVPMVSEQRSAVPWRAEVNDEASLARALMGLSARADELGLDAESVLRDALLRSALAGHDETSSPE